MPLAEEYLIKMSEKIRFYAKIAGISIGALFGAALFVLYFKQNKFFYHPKFPVLKPCENPKGYRNPGERKMKYKDIEAVS